MDNWGVGVPELEAYSRVTNPERFRPLHDMALRLFERLETAFDVERVAGYGIDHELEKGELVRSTVRLIPRNLEAAPLAISFSAFPGLHVRAGHWYLDHFPSCGCDACAETPDGEETRLVELIDDVTWGRFREVIRLPLVGDGWWESELWSPGGRSSSRRSRIDRSLAHQMLAGKDSSFFGWKPWPSRK
jgi:hypothetical protein